MGSLSSVVVGKESLTDKSPFPTSITTCFLVSCDEANAVEARREDQVTYLPCSSVGEEDFSCLINIHCHVNRGAIHFDLHLPFSALLMKYKLPAHYPPSILAGHVCSNILCQMATCRMATCSQRIRLVALDWTN